MHISNDLFSTLVALLIVGTFHANIKEMTSLTRDTTFAVVSLDGLTIGYAAGIKEICLHKNISPMRCPTDQHTSFTESITSESLHTAGGVFFGFFFFFVVGVFQRLCGHDTTSLNTY